MNFRFTDTQTTNIWPAEVELSAFLSTGTASLITGQIITQYMAQLKVAISELVADVRRLKTQMEELVTDMEEHMKTYQKSSLMDSNFVR